MTGIHYPNHIVASPSVNNFKTLLDRHYSNCLFDFVYSSMDVASYRHKPLSLKYKYKILATINSTLKFGELTADSRQTM